MTMQDIARRGKRVITAGIVIMAMGVLPSFAKEPSVTSQERERFIQSVSDIVKEISPTMVRFLLYDKKNILVEEGNGFFLNEEGEVVTSAQMLRSAYRAEIKVSNGRRYPVKDILAEDLFGEGVIVSADIPKESITVASFTKKSIAKGEELVLPAVFSDSSKSGEGMIFPVKGDWKILYNAFHRLVFLKEEGKALQVLGKLISGYPESPGLPNALSSLVNYYWMEEKQQEAKTWTQEFLKRFPGHPYKDEVNMKAQISFTQYREQLQEKRRKQ
jgi:hypothetical protein